MRNTLLFIALLLMSINLTGCSTSRMFCDMEWTEKEKREFFQETEDETIQMFIDSETFSSKQISAYKDCLDKTFDLSYKKIEQRCTTGSTDMVFLISPNNDRIQACINLTLLDKTTEPEWEKAYRNSTGKSFCTDWNSWDKPKQLKLLKKTETASLKKLNFSPQVQKTIFECYAKKRPLVSSILTNVCKEDINYDAAIDIISTNLGVCVDKNTAK